MSTAPVRLWSGLVRDLARRPLPPADLDEAHSRFSGAVPVAFAARRRLLRDALDEWVGPSAAASRVELVDGRLRIAGPFPETHAVVAATPERAVCALAARGPIGVDIEIVKDVSAFERVAGRFAPCERQALEQVPHAERARAFLALWTAKESWAKAAGRTLDEALEEAVFAVSRDCHGLRLSPASARLGTWRFDPFVLPGHAGCVCSPA